jgi:hypothetical protein
MPSRTVITRMGLDDLKSQSRNAVRFRSAFRGRIMFDLTQGSGSPTRHETGARIDHGFVFSVNNRFPVPHSPSSHAAAKSLENFERTAPRAARGDSCWQALRGCYVSMHVRSGRQPIVMTA